MKSRADSAVVASGTCEAQSSVLLGRLGAPHVLTGMLILFAAAFVSASWIKFHYFIYHDFDLAHRVQECHMILHGSLQNTLLGTNFLGNHMALIMFPIALIYAVLPSPMTLLVLQALAAVSGAVPIYLIFRRLLNRDAGLALALVYLAQPALGYTVLFEFHPVVFGSAFLLWALWAFPLVNRPDSGRYRLFLLFALLGLSTQENFCFIVIMLGLYAAIFVRRGRLKWSATALGLGLVWFLVFVVWLIPALNQGRVGFENIYPQWGRTPLQIVGGVLQHPGQALQFLFGTPGDALDTGYKQVLYLHVFVPVLLLSFLSPSTLALMAPVWFQQMLSVRRTEHVIYYHYMAYIFPIVVVSAGMGLRNALRWLAPAALRQDLGRVLAGPGRVQRTSRVLLAALWAATVLSTLAYGPVGVAQVGLIDPPPEVRPWPTANQRLYRPYWDRLVASVPPNVPAVSSFAFQARLADRMRIYSFHNLYSGSYTLTRRPFPVPEGIEAVLVDLDDPLTFGSWRSFEAATRVRAFLERENLKPEMMVGSSVLFLRDAPHAPTLLEVIDRPATAPLWPTLDLINTTGATLPLSPVRPGELFPLSIDWYSPAGVKVWLGFRLTLRSGRNGDTFVYSRLPVGYNLFLPHEWPAGKTVRQHLRLPVPDLPDGDYGVRLTLFMLDEREHTWSIPIRTTPTGVETLPTLDLGVLHIRALGEPAAATH